MKTLRVLGFLSLAVGAPTTETADLASSKQPVAQATLKPGETLEAALLRAGIGPTQAGSIITALSSVIDMRRIRPGERLFVSRDGEGRVTGVAYWRAALERYELKPAGDHWQPRKVPVSVVTREVPVAGVVESSLFVSLERLNERPALTASLVRLFEWDFDFAADALPGDRFRLLLEKRFADGRFVGYGDILIAQYRSAGRPTLTAVRFLATDGKPAYFDAEGRSIRKMFLRAPLDFTRVTSGYSQGRRHPVLGGVRPHLAVDYGAPMGTPVRAVADGVVEAAGWRGASGISITLRHARGYKTMYNHLSRLNLRQGQRVRQRQVIGRVGSTGLSTGPHLDYRVVKHGHLVNPLSERFVPGSPFPPERQAAFRKHLQMLLRRLDGEAPLPDAGRPRRAP